MFTKFKLGALALLISLVPAVAASQTVKTTSDTTAPAATVSGITGGKSIAMPAVPCILLTGSTAAPCSSSNPMPVTVVSSVAGGDASAANQTTGNTSLATIAINTTGVATSALQTTGNGYLLTLANTTATPGSTVPSVAQYVAGVGPSGNARGLSTSTSGGLLPGQAAPTSTRTVMSASTITTIDSARSGRLGLTVQVEATLTANLFLCANGQSGTCSATVYDAMVPSGAVAGTTYTFMFGPTGVIYAFTTGTPTLNTTSWLAQ